MSLDPRLTFLGTETMLPREIVILLPFLRGSRIQSLRLGHVVVRTHERVRTELLRAVEQDPVQMLTVRLIGVLDLRSAVESVGRPHRRVDAVRVRPEIEPRQRLGLHGRHHGVAVVLRARAMDLRRRTGRLDGLGAPELYRRARQRLRLANDMTLLGHLLELGLLIGHVLLIEVVLPLIVGAGSAVGTAAAANTLELPVIVLCHACPRGFLTHPL
jgi:hypothetical protein